MRLELNQVLSELGIEEAREVLEPFWEESENCFPPETPFFLQPARFTADREYVELPAELDPILEETARRIGERPALTHLAWHCYRLLFEHRQDYEGPWIGRWPSLEHVLGELEGVFYLIIALAVVPLTKKIHATRSVPDAYTRNTVNRFWEMTNNYRSRHDGRWGVTLRVLYWQRLYVSGDLYGTGRMEYMVRPFRGQLEAYRNTETGTVLALACDGARFAADGFMCEVAETDSEGGSWTAHLTVEDDAVTGSPISPCGMAVREPVRLPLATWRRVLAPGDPMLDTHIPAGGGMTPEKCEDTMRQALDFFPRYLPDHPFVGFACGSWILNPELADFYSPTSNMVLWQHELYLYPIPTPRRAGLYFVFGHDDVDPATGPRDTSLRRAFLDHMAAGGRLIVGGEFFLKEDIDHFGTQFYRSHWPPEGTL